MVAARTLRVAAVQVRSDDGGMEANLARAEPLVEEAARRGARLVVCPEFLAAGYLYDESIWSCGEPQGGATESWLQRLAARHRVYLGASYLEADGDDFYNTFALAGPTGSIAGRVRKQSLPSFEGWYFRSCARPKVIESEIGRIAVGICQDNHTARFFEHVRRDAPDLLLMPHSAPCLPLGVRLMRDKLRDIAPFYAREFGIPVVLVNKARAHSRTPVPGIPGLRLSFEFPGLSSVVDSDGSRLDELPDREGVVVADVHLDPARKRLPGRPPVGYWSQPPRRFRRILAGFFVTLEHLGQRAYARNPARIAAARAAAAPRRAA